MCTVDLNSFEDFLFLFMQYNIYIYSEMGVRKRGSLRRTVEFIRILDFVYRIFLSNYSSRIDSTITRAAFNAHIEHRHCANFYNINYHES